jgi:hypothetical protein
MDHFPQPSNPVSSQAGLSRFAAIQRMAAVVFEYLCDVPHRLGRGVVGQFHDATRKTLNHQGHKVSRRLCFQAFPSCTFVALVVNGFAN